MPTANHVEFESEDGTVVTKPVKESKKKLTTSCDSSIEHIIFDCEEVVPFHEDVCLKLVYLEMDGYEGQLIGATCCEKDGTPLEGGLIVVLRDGKFHRQVLTNPRLDFIAKDAKGRMKILQ